jgi:hypothetical protein
VAGTLLDLAERMESLAGAVPDASVSLGNEAAMAMVRYLTLNTPVDTSRALSNWQIGLGRPFMFDVGPFVEGKYGSTEAQSREQAIKAAQYLLSFRKPGQTIYLSNNAPYIRKLNDGYSKQSAGGFIEAAVVLGQKTATNARLLSQTQSGRFKPRKYQGEAVQ